MDRTDNKTVSPSGEEALNQTHHGGSQRMATIFLTASCNLKCPYCYATENKFSPKDQWTEERIEKLLSILGVKGFRLAVGGGEPLVEPERTLDIGRRATRANIPISLLTNGYLLNDSLLEQLFDAGYKWIQLSADSYKELCNFEKILVKGAELGLRMAIGTVLLPNRLDNIPKMIEQLAKSHVVGWRILRYTPLNDNPLTNKAPSNKEWIDLLLAVEKFVRSKPSPVQIRYEPSVIPLDWWYSISAPQRLDVCGGRNARRIFLFPDGEAYACGLPRKKGISLGKFEPAWASLEEMLDHVPPENCQYSDVSFRNNSYCKDICRGGCLQMRNGRICDPRCEIDSGLVPACCFEKLLLSPGRHADGKVIYPSEVYRSWLSN
jgi:MoaA/NifB/PqqE/SkfB family radical SAM enzyme